MHKSENIDRYLKTKTSKNLNKAITDITKEDIAENFIIELVDSFITGLAQYGLKAIILGPTKYLINEIKAKKQKRKIYKEIIFPIIQKTVKELESKINLSNSTYIFRDIDFWKFIGKQPLSKFLDDYLKETTIEEIKKEFDFEDNLSISQIELFIDIYKKNLNSYYEINKLRSENGIEELVLIRKHLERLIPIFIDDYPIISYNGQNKSFNSLKIFDTKEIIDELKAFNNNFFLLGLPRTGKTERLKRYLNNKINKEKYKVIFLQDLSISEFSAVLNSALLKIRKDKRPIILAVDNLNLITKEDLNFLQRLITQNPEISEKIVVPTNPFSLEYKPDLTYRSELSFVPALSPQTEQIQYIISKIPEKIPLHILNKSIHYSAGIPELFISTINFFISYGYLPEIDDILKEKEYVINKLLSFLTQIKLIDPELWAIFILMIYTSSDYKIIEFLENYSLTKETIHFFDKLNIKTFVTSKLLNELFFKIIREDFDLFIKEAFEILSKNTNKIPVITPDNKIIYVSNFLEYIEKTIKKKNVVRLDKVIINGQPIDLDNLHLKPFDKIEFKLYIPNEDKINKLKEVFGIDLFNLKDRKSRYNNYSKLRKKYRKLIHKGDLYSKTGNWKEALSSYENALALNIEPNWARVRIAHIYRLRGKFDKCQDKLRPAIRSTDNPFAFLCYSICQYWQGDIQEAINFTSKAIRIKPNYFNAHKWHLRYLLHLNDNEKIKKTVFYNWLSEDINTSKIWEYEKINPAEDFTFMFMAWLYFKKTKQYKRAEKTELRLIKLIKNKKLKIEQLPLSCFYSYIIDLDTNLEPEECNKVFEIYPALKIDIYLWYKLATFYIDLPTEIIKFVYKPMRMGL